MRRGLPQNLPPDTEILFVGFSYADLPLGKTFSAGYPSTKPGESVSFVSRIVAVTQQFGESLSEVPHGWKTICAVHFPGGTPALIREMPVVDAWYQCESRVHICNEDHLAAITGVAQQAVAADGHAPGHSVTRQE